MKTPITCIIVDNDPVAQKLISDHVDKLDHLKLLAVCQNAVQALKLIHNIKPVVLLLDTCLPDISGIQMLKMLTIYRPYIIFITDYPEYAAESYDLEVVDYLLKPVSFERFVRAISKVTQNMELRSCDFSFRYEDEAHKEVSYIKDNSFIVRNGKKLIKINIEEIFFIEGLGDYLKFHLVQTTIIVRMTIRRIEQVLKGHDFLQVNKSFIVNIRKIRTVDGSEIELSSGKKISIGGMFRGDVLENLEGRII